MTGSKSSIADDAKSGHISPNLNEDSDDEDESEIIEESPCSRWAKRREEVDQRDVPGIDCAYLAMDTEEGVEVVWNEVKFSERKNLMAQEEKIRQVFDNLTQLEHPNIIKFHKYWIETQTEQPRVVFITEYMSSGSLKQFLKRTKRNVKRLGIQAWKRWCTQILSALSYLHSCCPSIIHGNLTCDTIFIQHNGLVKIGSVAPDAIHHHVKSVRENIKNMHFVAPEYGQSSPELSSAVDIYSFGMCALEMAALEIQGNGDSGNVVTDEQINRTIDSLGNDDLIDFIRKCLVQDSTRRPTARELLFHPVLFEVPSLKLLSAHALVTNTATGWDFLENISETIPDEVVHRHYGPEVVVAEVRNLQVSNGNGNSVNSDEVPTYKQWRMSDVSVNEKLEKFVEDVKFGIYPLTCFELPHPVPPRQQASTPEIIDSVKSASPEPVDLEKRRVVNMMCNVKSKEDGSGLVMTILVRMDDKMNRQLSCVVDETDSAFDLANELVLFGLINEADRDKLSNLIEESLYNRLNVANPRLVSSNEGSDGGGTNGGIEGNNPIYNPYLNPAPIINSIS